MSAPAPPESTAVPRPRAFAPDLSRGMMLLLIAVANVSWFLYGRPTSGTSAHLAEATGLDAVWQAIAIVAVDSRSYPLFAFLFGYGIWQLYARQQSLGQDPKRARRLLQRRHLWLIAFGAVNAALLWYGDVLGAWGLLGLLVTWLFLRRKNRTLIVWASILLGILLLSSVSSLLAGILLPAEMAEMQEFAIPQPAAIPDYLASIGARLLFWVPLTLGQGVVGLVAPIVVLVAIVCARRGILESPATHRRLLAGTAIIGIAIGWLGAVPDLLVHFDVWAIPPWAPLALHSTTGLFAALGYAAVFALIAARYADSRPTGTVRSLTALGKRSLSGYLWQSVVFAPLLCAWGLGLGAVLTQWQAVLIAVATWLISVVVATSLDRAGKRGPAEWLLRRLVYRRAGEVGTPLNYGA